MNTFTQKYCIIRSSITYSRWVIHIDLFFKIIKKQNLWVVGDIMYDWRITLHKVHSWNLTVGTYYKSCSKYTASLDLKTNLLFTQQSSSGIESLLYFLHNWHLFTSLKFFSSVSYIFCEKCLDGPMLVEAFLISQVHCTYHMGT